MGGEPGRWRDKLTTGKASDQLVDWGADQAEQQLACGPVVRAKSLTQRLEFLDSRPMADQCSEWVCRSIRLCPEQTRDTKGKSKGDRKKQP